MSKWVKNRFGGSVADLGGGQRLSVQWDACRPKDSDLPPYRVTALGLVLRARFNTEDEGRAAAVDAAKRILDNAQKNLAALSG